RRGHVPGRLDRVPVRVEKGDPVALLQGDVQGALGIGQAADRVRLVVCAGRQVRLELAVVEVERAPLGQAVALHALASLKAVAGTAAGEDGPAIAGEVFGTGFDAPLPAAVQVGAQDAPARLGDLPGQQHVLAGRAHGGGTPVVGAPGA